MKKIEKLSDLIPDENNYNKGTEFGGVLIEKSFRKLGAGRSVLADKNGKLIAGNKAHEGVINAGFSDDDIIVVKTDGTKLVVVQRTDLDLNTRKGKEMALADNSTARANLSWDDEAIARDGWSKDELEAWGVSDWGEEAEEAKDDNYSNYTDIKTDIVLGDFINIGRHVLICGDSTDSLVLDRLLTGIKASLILLDPPYEIEISDSIFYPYSENTNIFLFHNDRHIVKFLSNTQFKFKKFFVFTHNGCAIPQEGGNEVFLTHILIAHLTNGDAPKLNKGNGLRTVINGAYRRSDNHPHEKPQSLLSDLLTGYTNSGDIVLDIFGGSGSTILACEQLNRNCRCVELSPQSCQIIINRMIEHDKNLEVKINGEKYTPLIL